ncbi:hypothetical protein ACIA78_21370 [Streptomyces xanthochromogenes]|uniref:hypothetical protein n=1 Tax=Streptomyces xanthochromogenes TaxID=67384 RepID=UPI0037AAA9C3
MTTPPPAHWNTPNPDYTPPAWYQQHPPAHADLSSFAPTTGLQPVGCRVCNAVPVAGTSIRAHQGFLLFMTFRSVSGPLCRDCGLALVREMTTRTLWQGWWGPLSLIVGAPFALLSNLNAFLKFRKLAQPTGRLGPHVPEGRSVLRRPAAYVALIPLCWAIWFIHGMATH